MEPVSRIDLEYPVKPIARWGHGRPPHAGIERLLLASRDEFAKRIEAFGALREDLLAIPREPNPADPTEPAWINGFLPGLDTVALYGFLRQLHPARYLEVGSGHSTRLARRAIRDGGLATRILSIDPTPRAEIAGLCDEALRVPLEEIELDVFDSLEAGDVLFVDGSHRVFTNSDATVIFLEVLPRLQPGVVVQIHDVFLPNDYPPEWSDRFYSEQYLLACWLLAESSRIEVLLPNAFASDDPTLRPILASLWEDPRMRGVERHGCSFWLRVRG